MSIRRELRGQIEVAKRRIRRAVGEAGARSASAGGRSPSGINVAGRANVVTASNVGEPGASRSVTGTQRVRIRQADGRTQETVDETRTTESSS